MTKSVDSTPEQDGRMTSDMSKDSVTDYRLPPYLRRHWMTTNHSGGGGSLLLPPIEQGSLPRQLMVPRFSPSLYRNVAPKEETSPDNYRLPPLQRNHWMPSYGDMQEPPPAGQGTGQQYGVLLEPTPKFPAPLAPKIIVIITLVNSFLVKLTIHF